MKDIVSAKNIPKLPKNAYMSKASTIPAKALQASDRIGM